MVETPQNSSRHVWVWSPDASSARQIIGALEADGYVCRTFERRAEFVSASVQDAPDALVVTAADAACAQITSLRAIRDLRPTPILAVVDGSAEQAARAFEAGADDAMRTPWKPAELVARVRSQTEARDARDRRLVRQLAQTRDFLSNVINSSPNAIVAAERTGEIVLFNRAAENILGWSAREAIGMSVRNLYPDGVAEEIMQMLRAPQYGGRGRLESRRETLASRDGEEIPVEISAAILYEDSQEAATVGIFTDLRQRLQMEERLQAATETLEKTRRRAMLAELAGATAHELNQPLTSLLGYAELLLERLDDDDPNRRPASIIEREATRIADIVRKIGRITNYRTKEYVAGAKIVDLDASLFDAEPEFDWLADADQRDRDEDDPRESE